MPNGEGKKLPSYIAEQPGKGPRSSGGTAGSVTRGRGGYNTTTTAQTIDKIWAADLDMQAFTKFNRGVKYLLAVVDVFSKYGWLIPLKDKTGKSVDSALKTIFKERKPEKMWVDKGKEFYNKDVKDLIELYSTQNEEKSSVVERWIRTMKEKMWKYFSANSTNVYINVLPDLVREYNNTRHSSIKMTLVKASKKENELRVWRNLYPDHLEIYDIKPKFSVGDKVRISKKEKDFRKRIYH